MRTSGLAGMLRSPRPLATGGVALTRRRAVVWPAAGCRYCAPRSHGTRRAFALIAVDSVAREAQLACPVVPPYDARMESMRLLRSSLRAGLAAAAGVCILGAAGSAGAQEYRSGFYVGLETGVALPSGVDSTVSGVNQPTRCDRLLYPASISPPDDAVCRDNTPGVLIANEFDPGVGFASGFIFGYAAGGPRFEVEYVNRYQGDDVKPLGGTKNPRVAGKNTEWANDVEEWIGDHHAHQVFANAYYDFLNDSRWTPYVGAGVGWAVTELSYYTQFTSKPAAEYLQIEFDPDWPEAAKRSPGVQTLRRTAPPAARIAPSSTGHFPAPGRDHPHEAPPIAAGGGRRAHPQGGVTAAACRSLSLYRVLFPPSRARSSSWTRPSLMALRRITPGLRLVLIATCRTRSYQ